MYLTQDQITEINNNLDPIALLERHGYRPKRSGNNRYSCQSLHRGDSDNAMSIDVSKGLWYDFTGIDVKSKNSGGNIFQLLLEFNDSTAEAVKEYEEITGNRLQKPFNDPEIDSTLQKKIYKLNENIKEWNQELLNPRTETAQKALNDLLQRGYTEEYIRQKQIGFNPFQFHNTLGSIIFPLFDIDKTAKSYIYKAYYKEDYTGNQIKYGFDSKDNPKYSPKGYWEKLLYNLESIRGKEHIYIVEGICDSDMLLIDDPELGSIALAGNSSFTEEKFDKSLVPAVKHKKITLIFDNDSTGINSFYPKAINRLIDNGIYDFNVEIVPRNTEATNKELSEVYKDHFNLDVATDFKDINDYFNYYHDLKGIHKTAVNAIYYLGLHYKNINDLDQFEKILRKVSRYFSKVKLLQILDDLKQNDIFSKDVIGELKKIINKAPTDNEVCEIVKEKHNIKYNGKLGFLEFDKVWRSREEQIIHRYIDKALGNFRKGSRYAPITKMLQADCYSEEIDFNQNELMIFQNGTLNLASGEFKKYYFSANDNMSNILSYDYDPKAKCDNWIHFLNDICEDRDNPKDTKNKISLLQEYAGYILFSDCILEKGLVLYGSGSNGKSVFMNTLKEVFKDFLSGDNNTAVSQVDISNLNRTFFTIKLKDSLINISSEAKDSLFGSEEQLKKIISGETIEDSYKNKDRISFTPRSKLIIAANNDIIPKDLSHGLERRMLFVSFKNKYVDEVVKENQKQKDIYLPQKLRSELSGIFNWCYEGYRRLKENGKFTLPEDHKNQLERYKDNINSVRKFVKDDSFMILFKENYIARKRKSEILRNALYRYYVGYCTRIHAKPLGEPRFQEEFERVLDDMEFAYIYTRSKKGMIYRFLPFNGINQEWFKNFLDCTENSQLQELKDLVDLPPKYDDDIPEPTPPPDYI